MSANCDIIVISDCFSAAHKRSAKQYYKYRKSRQHVTGIIHKGDAGEKVDNNNKQDVKISPLVFPAEAGLDYVLIFERL
jgi:hypothetical protein